MADTERTKAQLLTIYADGQLPGSIDPQDMRDYVVTTEANTRISTGLIDGGEVTINVDDTKFDIAAGSGIYVDNFTDPLNPVRIPVSWSAFTAVTVTAIGSQQGTEMGLDLSSGTAVIVQQAARFSVAQTRVIVSLGFLIHPTGIILSVFSEYSFVLDVQKTLRDLSRFIRIINVSGNGFGPNGANLQIDKTVGESFIPGINYLVSKQAPNNMTDPLLTAPSWFYLFQDGMGGFDFLPGITSIDPTKYDDGSGTLAGVGNNEFTIQRIWFFTVQNGVVIQFGQTLFSTFDDAVAAINTETVVFGPNLEDGFRCWLITKGNTTDLEADVAAGNAIFINAGRFGDVFRM